MLLATNLKKVFKKRVVVDGVSINVKKGEFVGLLGPNGAGKTTTFHMIIGLTKANQGKILLDGKDITNLPMYKRALLGIGYLPQESSIFKKLTVKENIMAVLETLPISQVDRELRIYDLLADLGIENLANNKAYTLSGGEKRKVEIARTLALSPSFILLDEPFAGIDPKTIIEIQKIIEQLRNRCIGILLTDHNVREALAITDRSYLIYDGKVLLSGTSRELAHNKYAREMYFGRRFRLE